MMLLAIVVLLNGVLVPGSPPVRDVGGHVMAPLGPVLSRLVERVTRAGDDIVLVRGARTCVFRLGVPAYRCDATIRLGDASPVVREDTVYVPLATVVRAFGGSFSYDPPHATVALVVPAPSGLATPVPYDPSAPQAEPTTVFTPQPAPATPRPFESGDPRPRRTAIPAIPSRVP